MRHILIVDDALDLGRLLKTVLSLIDSTMPIVVVPSGEEALLEGTRYPLDLLITDIRLPGISGVELIQKIRKHHPDVSIIVITGMSDEQIRRDVRQLGVDYFFTKPLSMPEFTDAARRCLKLGGEPEGVVAKIEDAGSEGQEKSQQFADVIGSLRHRLDAVAVALLNGRARVEAEAGSIPHDFNEETLTRLLAAANASLGVSGVFKKTGPEVVFTYRGEAFDLVATPVEHYLLMVILPASTTNLRLALCLEETLSAHAALKGILKRMGLVPPEVDMTRKPIQGEAADTMSAPEGEVAGSTEDLEAFESIFDKARTGDVDAFWEKASRLSGEIDAVDPEVLTYDQANQLGLTPDPDYPEA